MQFSLQAVRDVARLLHETELSEISVEDIDAETGQPFRVAVKRNLQATAPAALSQRKLSGPTSTQAASPDTSVTNSATSSTGPNLATEPDPASEQTGPSAVAVTSTAVGLFRQASPPLQVGDVVKRKQVVAIVESLKIPNEIAAPIAGRIETLLVEDGQGIEYGQTLLTIMPDDDA
jgi:acetyl-CoA carboxylase biotin carboxyl carrier protein